MKARYTGTDDARDLALSGGFITFKRGEWVDIEAAALEGGLRAEHAVIQARDLAGADDWEVEGAPRKPRKAAKRTTKKAATNAADEAPETTDPAEPVNEENDQ